MHSIYKPLFFHINSIFQLKRSRFLSTGKMWSILWKFNNKFNTKILEGRIYFSAENATAATYVYHKDIFLYFVYKCSETVNLFHGLVKSDKLGKFVAAYGPSYILGKKLRYFMAHNVRIPTIAKWNGFPSCYCCILCGILEQFFITNITDTPVE